MTIWRDFLLAVGFFTRIPVPDHPNFSDQALARSSIYFPAVGVGVGFLVVSCFWLANLALPTTISVLIALSFGFLVTGGFHEDGWADTFDGLGGAFDTERKLAIMTDSRLGTYGSLALWSLLTVKAFTLFELIPTTTLIVWVFAQGLSRWCAMSAMVWLPYVRTEPSKAKPIVQKLSLQRWLLSGLILLPCLFFLTWQWVLALLFLIAVLLRVAFHFLRRQIGGYTGDILGALQQGIELITLIFWLALST